MTRYRPPPNKRKGILVYFFWSVKAWQCRKREDWRIFLSCSDDKLDFSLVTAMSRWLWSVSKCVFTQKPKHPNNDCKKFLSIFNMLKGSISTAWATCNWISVGSLLCQTHSTLIMSGDPWSGVALDLYPSGNRAHYLLITSTKSIIRLPVPAYIIWEYVLISSIRADSKARPLMYVPSPQYPFTEHSGCKMANKWADLWAHW